MSTNKLLSEVLLQKAAFDLAAAINDGLPSPEECHHEFSEIFEEKMKRLSEEVRNKVYGVTVCSTAAHK